jgi:aminopeptidase N
VRHFCAAVAANVVLLLSVLPAAADTYPRNRDVDVVNYVFRLTLSDATDVIAGEATVDVRFQTDGVASLELDLAGPAAGTEAKGMTVASVSSGGSALAFEHRGDRLAITLAPPGRSGERRQVTVKYAGVPATGLRIGPNRHGERTFFTDNWPNKAHQWLPVIDHPYDKATSEFVITAPAHYQVVSNGLLVEETDLPDSRRLTHWKQSVPIPVWLNVIGVARFAVHHAGVTLGVPIQTWVAASDRDAGFYDFAVPTPRVLEFFGNHIGPYAYEKLANVQAAGVNGGMESATAIFYGESSVTGDRSPRWRTVVIHEIAHQWFGNAVTESDWDDVWLSEGFATYFTLLFVKHEDGHDAFVDGLKRSRATVLAFDEKNPAYRVVHDNLADMRQVLTGHIYQKGGWTLHMLRGLVGDDAFWRGIRAYYRRYRDGNASTADFVREMEEASGRELGWFFRQWLYRGGSPAVRGIWHYDAATKHVQLELEQVQPGGAPFRLPLEVGLSFGEEPRSQVARIEFDQRRQAFRIPVDRAPAAVELDPNTLTLMRAEVVAK